MNNILHTAYRRMDGRAYNTDIWINFCGYTRRLGRRLDDELEENWQAVIVGSTLHFDTEEDKLVFIMRFAS